MRRVNIHGNRDLGGGKAWVVTTQPHHRRELRSLGDGHPGGLRRPGCWWCLLVLVGHAYQDVFPGAERDGEAIRGARGNDDLGLRLYEVGRFDFLWFGLELLDEVIDGGAVDEEIDGHPQNEAAVVGALDCDVPGAQLLGPVIGAT